VNIFVKLSTLLIKFYKILISPFLLKSCRYDPSCSSYALEAFNTFGFMIGLKLTLKRIIRCHPWGVMVMIRFQALMIILREKRIYS
jgi:putative membrane protein insertion efficiency factor